MGSASSAAKPQELIEFRKLNNLTENVEIPERPENRRITDKKGFVLYGIAILLLLPLLSYTLTKSDRRHLTHTTDGCGNFCGLNNTPIEGVPCSGQNYLEKPYSNGSWCLKTCKYNMVEDDRICAAEISEYPRKPNFNFQEGLASYQEWRLFLAVLVAIVLSLLTLVVLKYSPVLVVWVSLVLAVIIILVADAGLWMYYFILLYYLSGDPVVQGFLASAIISTFITIVLLTTIFVLRKKISLVIQLFKEANKVLADMPHLIVVTILIIMDQLIILCIFYSTSFNLSFSMDLFKCSHVERVYEYEYTYSGLTIFTILLNIVVTIWTLYFFAGIQYMVISGSVARWFFAKNKQYLNSPILTSTKVTMKYHLGTVAFASLHFMLFSVVKGIVKIFCRNVCCKCPSLARCRRVDFLLKLFSEYCYTQTAIHGQSYWRSARRATNLLLANAKSVTAVNCVTNFLLVVSVLVLSTITTVIALGLFMINKDDVILALIPTSVVCIACITIVSMVFTTFQAIIDTLLVCVCEDTVLNDGVSRPYYMPRGLMEFVENSEKMFECN